MVHSLPPSKPLAVPSSHLQRSRSFSPTGVFLGRNTVRLARDSGERGGGGGHRGRTNLNESDPPPRGGGGGGGGSDITRFACCLELRPFTSDPWRMGD